MGKRVLGLVQLSGLNLVPNPPASIIAFSECHLFRFFILSARFNINSYVEELSNLFGGSLGVSLTVF